MSMKRLFAAKKKAGEEEEDNAGNTLDRLVRDKEGVRRRLEEEERDFLERRREYVRSIIQFETQEVERREKELQDRRADLQEKRRLNQAVQDKFVEQMKLLQIKLEEVRDEHARTESSLEAEISGLENKLVEVQGSLADRIAEAAEPSAPLNPEAAHLYPDLHSIARHPTVTTGTATPKGLPALRPFSELRCSARSISMQKITEDRKLVGGSAGSSPQMSIASTMSANSDSSI